jgi:hypothetical protein
MVTLSPSFRIKISSGKRLVLGPDNCKRIPGGVGIWKQTLGRPLNPRAHPPSLSLTYLWLCGACVGGEVGGQLIHPRTHDRKLAEVLGSAAVGINKENVCESVSEIVSEEERKRG